MTTTPYSRWVAVFITLFLMTGLTADAIAGCLGKPRLFVKVQWEEDKADDIKFDLINQNNDFSLETVGWKLEVRLKLGGVYKEVTGEATVGKGATVPVVVEDFIFTDPGDYQVKVTANSEVNICGEQSATSDVQVIAPPPCTTPPTRVPAGMLVLTAGNTITYTAPQGCCFTIDPFINTGVWYNLSPATKQTISDGQSVTFTVTPKDNKPLASIVAFQWKECATGEPNGKDYIVITPSLPLPRVDTTNLTNPGPYFGIFGDPVSVATGAFVRDETDLIIPGIPQLTWSRHYDSRALENGVLPSMGLNWMHSFSAQLVNYGTTAVVTLEDGRRVFFTKTGNAWTANAGTSNASYAQATLTEGATSFVFTDLQRKRQVTFNAAGRATKIDDGRIPVTITWQGADIKSATDGLGHTLTFTTDSLSRITAVSDGDRTVTYTYSAGHELTSVVRPTFDTFIYAYAASVPGRLTSISSNGSPLLTNTYSASGRVTAQTDAEGGAWSYTYGASTASITFPDGVVENYAFDAAHRVTSAGATGQEVTFTYRSDGTLESVEGGEGGRTTYEWLASGHVKSMTTSDGTTSYTYAQRDMNGTQVMDLAGVTYPDGSSVAYSYDAKGRLTGYRDGNGKQWTYTVDAATGNITAVTDPLGRKQNATYDAGGRLKTASSVSGATTTLTRNRFGYIAEIQFADATKRMMETNSMGGVTKFTDATGAQTQFTLDGQGRITQETLPNGGRRSYTYDKLGNLIEVTHPSGDAYTYGYNDAGRLTTIHDADNKAITFNYNATGDIVGITDRLGNTTSMEVDADKNIVAVTSPLGLRTTLNRDARGRLSGMTSPMGRTASFSYDKRDNIASITDGSGRTVEFTYDKNGRESVQRIGGLLTASYAYDDAGVLKSVTDPEGGSTSYTYDQSGRLASIVDAAGRTTTYAYDGRDRVNAITIPGATASALTYDAENHLASIAYPNGLTYQYRYNGLGQLTRTYRDSSAYDADGRLIYSNGISSTWKNGNIATYKYGSMQVEYTYDASGRPTAIKAPSGATTTFTYDKDGRLLTVVRPNGVTTTYEYDDDGQVKSISEGSHTTILIDYDNGGRVVTAQRSGFPDPTITPSEWSATYDAGNVRTDVAHDDAGRTTQLDGSTAQWNEASQLIALTGDVTATFEYDGLNRLIHSVVDGVTTDYTWSDHVGDGIIGVVRTNGASRFVVPHPSGTVFMVIDSSSGDILYPHYTESGHVHMVTDQDGNIRARMRFDPYGIPTHSTTDLTDAYPFGYGGASGSMVYISGTLYATTGRMYDAEGGRFLSHDPVRSLHAQNMNAFQYARQDPVNMQDWSGRAPGDAPQADDPYAGFSQEFRDRMREIEERYEREMKKIEEEFAKRREEREAQERRRREQDEELRRQREEEDRRIAEDREKLDRAQDKVRKLNEMLDPPPPPPPPPTPAPTGDGGSTPGVGGTSTRPGGQGQPPSSGGTRRRQPGGTGTPPKPNGTNTGPPTPPTPPPAPLGPNGGTGRGGYNPNLPYAIQYLGALGSGFIEGLSPSYIWDYYTK